MVGAGSGGRGHSVRPEGRNEEPTPWRSEPRGILGPLSPHPTLSLHLVALCPGAGDSQRVHVFPRRVPNGKQGGGESWGTSVFGASLSPPTTSSTPRRGDELSASRQAAVSPLRWLSGSGLRGRGRRARRLPTFPKHNPREISTPGGGGGCGMGRGREPGAQISTRILFARPAPAADRAGRGMDRGMFSLSGGMHVERKWSSSEPNFLKNPQATQPARPPPLGRSRAARRSAIRRRQEPGISHPRGLGSRGGRRSGSGRRPAPGGAQRGGGGAGTATRRGPTSRAPAPARRAPRVPALGCRSLAARPPALPLGLFSLRRCASESPSL